MFSGRWPQVRAGSSLRGRRVISRTREVPPDCATGDRWPSQGNIEVGTTTRRSSPSVSRLAKGRGAMAAEWMVDDGRDKEDAAESRPTQRSV